MKRYLLSALTIICFNGIVWPQGGHKKIVGIVYEENSSGGGKKPVPAGASIFIPGVASSTTDNNGYYSLDISKCMACKTGELIKIYVNSKIGYAERDYTIPINPDLKPFDIGIVENKKLALNGVVKDAKTGKFLKGIKVTVVIQNMETIIPSVITNENGVFQIIIRKEGILNMQAIQLFFSDADQSKYKDTEKIVFINQYAPVIVGMDECIDCGAKYTLKVNTYVKTSMKIEAGDLVIIKATGTMNVGALVGTSGPEGLRSGVMGVSLSGYNYFPDWNHAVLFYRFGENDEWKHYDDGENKYLIQYSGFIEFGINDKQEMDNSGAYQVEVIIRK